MRFCPTCSNYLFLMNAESAETDNQLILQCRHCGYSTIMNPTNSSQSLVLETSFVSQQTTQTQSQFNEYTQLDPTIPHLTTIVCPNEACDSQSNPALRDILYIKTDAKNLKFQYMCTVCKAQWSS